MSQYFIGIEDHHAWANLVSLATSGPLEVLLDRRRVELLDPPLAASPYHHDTNHSRTTVARRPYSCLRGCDLDTRRESQA